MTSADHAAPSVTAPNGNIRFRFEVRDLVRALDLVSIVQPAPVRPDGELAYSFTVGTDTCTIGSVAPLRFARATLPIVNEQGQEGVFLFPLPHVDALRSVDGIVTLSAGTEGSAHWIAYNAESGARSRRSTSDPRLVRTLERTVAEAKHGLTAPPRVLRELLRLTKSFLAGPQDHQVEAAYQSITVFDGASRGAKDGVVYASTGLRSIYIHTALLRDAAFAVHGQHLSPILSFLSRATGDVTVTRGSAKTLASTSDQALGWTDVVSQHERFTYHRRSQDAVAFVVKKQPLIRALEGIRHEVASGIRKVVLQLLPAQLLFSTASARTAPIDLRIIHGTLEAFDVPINVDQMVEIVRDVRDEDVELRLVVRGREGSRVDGFLRTVESFHLSASGVIAGDDDDGPRFPMRVTRLIATMR